MHFGVKNANWIFFYRKKNKLKIQVRLYYRMSRIATTRQSEVGSWRNDSFFVQKNLNYGKNMKQLLIVLCVKILRPRNQIIR